MISMGRVQDLFFHVLGKQACQVRQADWSEHVLPALRPKLTEAVDLLAEAFGGASPPSDPIDAVWRASSRLDLAHRTMLAELLMKERPA